MLNLDTVKTRTIYSKVEIQSLYFQFRQILNQAYQIQSQLQVQPLDPQTQIIIQSVPDTIKLLYYLKDVFNFLKQFNEIGEMQTLSMLQVLFMKSSHWKSYKEITQSWVAILMKEICRFVIGYNIKPQISTKSSHAIIENQDIAFYAIFLGKVSRSNNTELMMVCISFLRVFIINELQNKKREFKLIEQSQSNLEKQPWIAINESLIKIKINIDDLKKQQICISICYWLCNAKSQFINECIKKGMVGILCQSLKHKDISQWYGKKIINFLKLLLLQISEQQQSLTNISIAEFETCVTKFTMKYDSEQIMKQARILFSYLKNGEGKIQKQQQSYQSYIELYKNKEKTEKQKCKGLNKAVENTRILLLYGEDTKLKTELEQKDNQQYLLVSASKKQQQLVLLNQLWNLIAYNYKHKQKDNTKTYPPKIIIEHLTQILSTAKHKPELNSNKKKLLISYIRMIKQLLSPKQNFEVVAETINQYNLIKKLYKFSDCTNFRYQRELFSLQSLLNRKAGQDEHIPHQDRTQIMKALAKHLQSNTNNKFIKRNPEQDLEQVQLFYEMVKSEKKGSHQIDGATVKAISKKMALEGEANQNVEIRILDSSESERNNELGQQINYYVIGSLNQLQKKNQSSHYQIDEAELQKIIKLGNDPKISKETLKEIVQYLEALISKKRMPEKYEKEATNILNKYYSDSSLVSVPTNNQTSIQQPASYNQEQLLQDIQQKQLNQNQLSYLLSSSENNHEIVSSLVKLFANNQIYHDPSVLSTSQGEQQILTNIIMFLISVNNRINRMGSLWKDVGGESFLKALLRLLKMCYENPKIYQKDLIKKLLFNIFYVFLKEYALFHKIKILPQCEQQAYTEVNKQLYIRQEECELLNEYLKAALQLSYQEYWKQTIYYTDAALQIFPYQLPKQETEKRPQKYLSLIYTKPEYIDRQISQILHQSQSSGLVSKFWSLHHQSAMQQLQSNNILIRHFLSSYFDIVSNGAWEQFNLETYYHRLLELIEEENAVLIKKIQTGEDSHKETEYCLKKLCAALEPIKKLNTNKSVQLTLNDKISQYNTIVKFLVSCQHGYHSKNSKGWYWWSQYIQMNLHILKETLKDKLIVELFSQKTSPLFDIQLLGKIFKLCITHTNIKYNELLMEMVRVMLLKDQGSLFDSVHHKLFNDHQQELMLMNDETVKYRVTEKGQEHYDACLRIIDFILDQNNKKLRQQYFKYFFGEQEKETTADLEFTDEELIRHLKNLLNPPYQYGIIQLSKHLRVIQSKEASNIFTKIFNQVDWLFMEDVEKGDKIIDHRKSMKTIPASVTQIEEKLVESIWGPGIELSPDFYRMIKKNMTGLKACLKTKKIDEEGVSIVCQKFYECPSQIAICSYILHLNVHDKKQWQIVHNKKIVGLINSKYPRAHEYQTDINEFVEYISYLIGSSGQYKQIQEQYTLQENIYENLKVFEEDFKTLISVVYALSGVVYTNEKNQKLLGNLDQVKFYRLILQKYSEHEKRVLLFEMMCRLLSNLIYQNLQLISVYLETQMHKIVFRVFVSLEKYDYSAYKQFLRLVGNMSLTLQGAYSIALHTPFLQLLQTVGNEAIENNHIGILKYLFKIIFYLLNYHEIEAKTIAYRIYQLKCTPIILNFLAKLYQDPGLIISGLEALNRIFIVESNRQAGIKQGNLLPWMEQVSTLHAWNNDLFGKWLRVFFQISRQQCILLVMETQLLLRLASFVKNHSENCEEDRLSILIDICNIYSKNENKKKIASSGLIDLLCQVLRLRSLKSQQASKILDDILLFHQSKSLSPQSYTKIFQGLISRLQIQYREENSLKIINILIKIRDKILVTTRSSTILLQFGYMYLTQKQILLSNKYHKRVREFITLLSYFIAFNIELRMVFAHEQQKGFIQILESWIRIDKSLEEDNSISEACRLCIFVIYNDQRFLTDVTESMRVNQQAILDKLNTKYKCLLYRRNHTNKNAYLHLKKTKENTRIRQLIAYKSPDGDIKEKYTLPLTEMITMRSDFSEGDKCLKQSVFSNPGGFFQKNANLKNCVTVVAIVGEQLSIRQLDLQFIKREDKEKFVSDFKDGVSLQFKQNRSDF